MTDGQLVLEAWLPETGKPGRSCWDAHGVIARLNGGEASTRRLNLNTCTRALRCFRLMLGGDFSFQLATSADALMLPAASEAAAPQQSVFSATELSVCPAGTDSSSGNGNPPPSPGGRRDLEGGWGSARGVKRAKWRERGACPLSPQPIWETVQAVAMGSRPA